jgi:hypothetical protein
MPSITDIGINFKPFHQIKERLKLVLFNLVLWQKKANFRLCNKNKGIKNLAIKYDTKIDDNIGQFKYYTG